MKAQLLDGSVGQITHQYENLDKDGFTHSLVDVHCRGILLARGIRPNEYTVVDDSTPSVFPARFFEFEVAGHQWKAKVGR